MAISSKEAEFFMFKRSLSNEFNKIDTSIKNEK